MRTTPIRLLALALAAALALAVTGCSQAEQTTEPTTPPAAEQTPPTEAEITELKGPEFPVKDVTKLQSEDLKVGTGAEATAGKTAVVHYTGWLTDGTKFDSSVDSGQPFEFPVGAGMVIKGWDEGVQGMKVGGQRRLIIPADMGYGEQGAGGVIPPGATLVFDVELLEVK